MEVLSKHPKIYLFLVLFDTKTMLGIVEIFLYSAVWLMIAPYTHWDLRGGKLKLHLKTFVTLKINLDLLFYIKQKKLHFNCIHGKQNQNCMFYENMC